MISTTFQKEVWDKLNSIERRLSLAGGGGSFAPSDAQYLTLSLSALLPNERVLTAGVGLGLVDGGAGGAATLNVDVGIADDDIAQIDMVGVADNDYAKFTAAGLEGRSYAEVLSDLSAQALAAFNWNTQNLANIGTLSANGITDISTVVTNIASGTIGQRPGGIVGDIRFNTTLGRYEFYDGAWENVLLSGNVGIADNDILSVDLAGGLVATEIVRATAAGLESRSNAQILAQLSASAGATFNWNAQNLTNIGTIGAASGSTIGNLTFADGSITDSGGAISFGNENLSTTGTLGAGITTVGTANFEAHLIFRRGGSNYIQAPAGGSFIFVPNGLAVGAGNSVLILAADKTACFGGAIPTAGVSLTIHNAADAFCRTRLYGSQIALRKITFAGGSWARNLLQFEEHDGTIYTMVGAKGTDNTFQYGFIGEAFNDVALAWDASENVGIGVYAWGTNAEQVLAVGTGVAPTTSPADCFQMYSADIVGGNAAPHFRTENDDIIKLYKYVDADFGNAINSGDADTDGAISAIISALTAHGLIAAA